VTRNMSRARDVLNISKLLQQLIDRIEMNGVKVCVVIKKCCS